MRYEWIVFVLLKVFNILLYLMSLEIADNYIISFCRNPKVNWKELAATVPENYFQGMYQTHHHNNGFYENQCIFEHINVVVKALFVFTSLLQVSDATPGYFWHDPPASELGYDF